MLNPNKKLKKNLFKISKNQNQKEKDLSANQRLKIFNQEKMNKSKRHKLKYKSKIKKGKLKLINCKIKRSNL